MACSLKLSPTPDSDFVGATGTTVTLKMAAPAGVGVQIDHMRYAGVVVLSPFQITLQPGVKKLVVLVEATQPGALLEFREDCGSGADQVLDTFHWDPENPAIGFFLQGA